MSASSKYIFILLIFSFSTVFAEKEVIQFQDEELETETVLPIFPQRVAVKNKLISVANKVEIGFAAGTQLNQALYNPISFSVNGTYHLDEAQAIRLSFFSFSTSLSTNAEKLKDSSIVGGGNEFDASRAPIAQSLISLDYEYGAIYGKLGLTKRKVLPLTTHFILGLGLVSFEGDSEMAINLGLGEKLFLTKNFALKVDFNVLIHQGPNPMTVGVDMSPGGAKHAASDFSSKTYFNQTLMAGAVMFF